MKVQGLVATLAVAAVTSAFTLAVLRPGAVGAVDDAVPTIQPKIATPELTTEGCTFTLSADKAEYQPGESPVLTLKSANPTDKPVETKVQVQMWSSSPVSRMSRSLPIPRAVWSGEQSVRLEPGETRSIELPTGTALPANQQVTFSLTTGQQSILAGQLIVGNPVQAVQAQGQMPVLLNSANRVNQAAEQ